MEQQVRDEINARWERMTVRPDKVGDVKWCLDRIMFNKPRYLKVQETTGYPWWFIAILHGMECGFSFGGWLANGDPLDRPTVHVPAGLRCNGSWEDAARVSLEHEWSPKPELGTVADALWAFERFNGTGYRKKGKPSQYVWSYTTIEEAGRYVRDNVWDDNAWSGQTGCAAMLQAIIKAGLMAFEASSDSVENRVTWLEIHRLDQGGQSVAGVAAYAGADCLASWTGTDKAAMIQFMNRFPGAASVLVAPSGKAWPAEVPIALPKEIVCRLVRTGVRDAIGCEKLVLEFVGTGETLFLRSGVPSKQTFRKADDGACLPGSLEPLPQPPKKTDFYWIHDIEWAGGKDNYDTTFSAALGPVKVWLEANFNMRRSEFLFHVDGGAPGSAGCACVRTIEDLKKLVALLRKYDPKKLFVDWGV